MVRRHLTTLRLVLMLADGVTAGAVFLVVSLLRFGDGESGDFWRRLGIDIRVAAILFAVVWVTAMWSMDLYRLQVRWRLVTEARDIARATIVVLMVTLSTLFVLNEPGVSRLFLVLLFAVQPAATWAGRAILWYGFAALRRRGLNTRYMLIAGTGTLAQDFADRVEARSTLGIRVIGHVSVPEDPHRMVSRPILGTAEDIEAIIHSRIVDEIAVCLPPTAGPWLDSIARAAADEGKTVRIPTCSTRAIASRVITSSSRASCSRTTRSSSRTSRSTA